jgi:excisionase family DNA binding protein
VKPAYLGIKEAAEYVGVGAKSIRNLLDLGKLTRYRPVGRRVVISLAELDNYMRTSADR